MSAQVNRRSALKAGMAFAGFPFLKRSRSKAGSVLLKAGKLSAVVGDNSEGESHRAGYNGLWSLQHTAASRSLFVPGIAGLNLEHIVNGEPIDDPIRFFEPRNAPMELKVLSEREAELHQPPTPFTHIESWTRFAVLEPDIVEMTFRFVPHSDVFPHKYLSLFWASYLNAPDDKSMYFRGGLDGQTDQWVQYCTQYHNDQSTVLHRNDQNELRWQADSRDALFRHFSRLRFDQPFFYGRFENLTWLVMFDRTEGIRFTHSPSGGGGNAERQTSNPAWDFQYVVLNPVVGQSYEFRVRTILREDCSRDDILKLYEDWKQHSGSR